jgi:hypothetical protein
MEKKNLPVQNYTHFLNDSYWSLADTITELQGIDYMCNNL